MGGAIAVDDGHLHVHEDDVGFLVRWTGRGGCEEVVEGFFTVPDCGDDKAEFADCFEGYLLVDGTVGQLIFYWLDAVIGMITCLLLGGFWYWRVLPWKDLAQPAVQVASC